MSTYTLPSQPDRLARARCSLEGLSVGDAFGEQVIALPDRVESVFGARTVSPPPWPFTDDTQMALSIVAVLRQCGAIDQDRLAQSFAEHFEPRRGYGLGMHRMLPKVRRGSPWREAAQDLFGGQGSFGNGAAMRVAPLGAFFADDLGAAVEHARLSAEVTHAHPEGVAGAVAVAVAAAWAWCLRDTRPRPSPAAFLDLLIPSVPESKVLAGIQQARELPDDTLVWSAVRALGNGSYVSAQDTVPFVLWCASRRLDNYEEALWLTARGLGDVDTNCAMVGGIVAAYTGADAIPAPWISAREPLPLWPFADLEKGG